jgi:cathepsin L
MRLTIALLCLAAVAYSAPLGNSEMTEMFSAFKSEFNKVYETETELLQRYEMFTKNVNIINNHNENGAASAGYTMAINQFTDWTTQEFSAYLTYNGTAKKHDRIVLLDETDLATSVDWTTKGAVTPVKNQAQCGSCWAFSTTGSAEGALAIAAGLGANSLVSLSEQELVDCAGSFGNQGCNGGLMDDGFKFLEADGDSTEADYAYTGKTGTCDSKKETAASGLKKAKITSYSDVTPKSCTQLMAAVAKGPVSVAIEADQTGFQHYSTGVFSGTCGTSLDHGVLVVGYGTDGSSEYWKVKNSWGTTWGDAGYIRMTKSCSSTGRRLLGGKTTAGECGILSQPSYPVV